MSSARRTLKFATLDEAVKDAENLIAKGYDKTGQWNLGQVSGHLANWLGYGMDGFPRMPAAIRLMLWVARQMIGPRQLRKTLATGDLGRNSPTIPASVPPADTADADGVERFKAMVERANRFADEPRPSPFFGPMDRDEWVKLNCVHAAHHLSFLVPK